MIQQSLLFFFRLNGDRNGGAWCSASPVSRELGTKEWIEVDLGSMHCITGIMTQGRFGNGRGVEYTEAYKLNYWRPGMTDFVEYHDNIGRSVSQRLWYTCYVLPAKVSSHILYRKCFVKLNNECKL